MTNGLWWVVVNEEEQFSISAADQETPGGWQTVGPRRSKEDCLAFIDRAWSDMRPKSLREDGAHRD